MRVCFQSLKNVLVWPLNIFTQKIQYWVLKNADSDANFESVEKLQEVSAKIIHKKGPNLLF